MATALAHTHRIMRPQASSNGKHQAPSTMLCHGLLRPALTWHDACQAAEGQQPHSLVLSCTILLILLRLLWLLLCLLPRLLPQHLKSRQHVALQHLLRPQVPHAQLL
jgi:hypothetical protein